jgi:hypothetical protein
VGGVLPPEGEGGRGATGGGERRRELASREHNFPYFFPSSDAFGATFSLREKESLEVAGVVKGCPLIARGASFSHREKVAAERPDEGFRARSSPARAQIPHDSFPSTDAFGATFSLGRRSRWRLRAL